MPTERETYAGHAREYEALVAREDYQGNILKAIRDSAVIEGSDVIDMGAGTGRLACLLAPHVRSVWAFDLSPHMLGVARDKLKLGAGKRWMTVAADHRSIPLPPACADLILSGWSVSYVAVWQPERWRSELAAWMSEARRLLRPGGHIILFESMGTGNEQPSRLEHLKDFYSWLDETGLQSTWIRTDYKFDSPEQAAEIAGFFFGDEMRHRIERERLRILPECTGVWWLEPSGSQSN